MEGSRADPGSSQPIFACEGIFLDLGGREILRDISLRVVPGEVLGIIGPNGAGKTSLFEVLSGRMQPKSGRVLFRGRDITRTKLYQRAQMGIGRTYQTPVVPDELTVGETLKAARQAYRPYLTPNLRASASSPIVPPSSSTRSSAASSSSPASSCAIRP
jgi:branched-chain amino acid transport system ATP-binding protein